MKEDSTCKNPDIKEVSCRQSVSGKRREPQEEKQQPDLIGLMVHNEVL